MLGITINSIALPSTFSKLIAQIGGTAANPTVPTVTTLPPAVVSGTYGVFCVDPLGQFAYATSGGHSNTSTVYKINLATFAVTTIMASSVFSPSGVKGMCVDPTGTTIYAVTGEYFNGASGYGNYNTSVISFPAAGGSVTAIAGGQGATVIGTDVDGTGAAANFALGNADLGGICTDGLGNLYIGTATHLRKVVISTGVVTTFANSSNGFTGGLQYGASGSIYCADGYSGDVVQMSLGGVAKKTYSAGAGPITAILGVDSAEANIYFVVSNLNGGKALQRANLATDALVQIVAALPNAANSTINNGGFSGNSLIFMDATGAIQQVSG